MTLNVTGTLILANALYNSIHQDEVTGEISFRPPPTSSEDFEKRAQELKTDDRVAEILRQIKEKRRQEEEAAANRKDN